MRPSFRLALTAALLLGWIGYLGWTALTKSRSPIVSRAQLAAAEAAVVVELQGTDSPAKVRQQLWGTPLEGDLRPVNLSLTRGFTGPGEYLLLLARRRGLWEVVGPQRSPGVEPAGLGPPLIYPWSEELRQQLGRNRPSSDSE